MGSGIGLGISFLRSVATAVYFVARKKTGHQQQIGQQVANALIEPMDSDHKKLLRWSWEDTAKSGFALPKCSSFPSLSQFKHYSSSEKNGKAEWMHRLLKR